MSKGSSTTYSETRPPLPPSGGDSTATHQALGAAAVSWATPSHPPCRFSLPPPSNPNQSVTAARRRCRGSGPRAPSRSWTGSWPPSPTSPTSSPSSAPAPRSGTRSPSLPGHPGGDRADGRSPRCDVATHLVADQRRVLLVSVLPAFRGLFMPMDRWCRPDSPRDSAPGKPASF